jgi:hypothetical protein
MPVCLTREVRRAPDDCLKWPEQAPRILFVAAAPPGVASIPLEAHLLALRRAIAPWVKYYDPNDAGAREKILRNHFVFLPNASLEAIEDECASSSFTHVHILAHGVAYEDGHDRRFGLALHDARNLERIDRVNGTRLAMRYAPRDAPARTPSRSLRSSPWRVAMPRMSALWPGPVRA